jgi:hypothetical protein
MRLAHLNTLAIMPVTSTHPVGRYNFEDSHQARPPPLLTMGLWPWVNPQALESKDPTLQVEPVKSKKKKKRKREEKKKKSAATK